MKVYAIATQTSECYGHGDYGEEWKIEKVNAYHEEGTWNPVFSDRKTAQEFLDKIEFNHDKKVVELELLKKLEEKGGLR